MASNETNIRATTHFADLGQMRILDLPGAVPYGETALPIGPTEVAFADQRRSDLSMLKEANLNQEERERTISLAFGNSARRGAILQHSQCREPDFVRRIPRSQGRRHFWDAVGVCTRSGSTFEGGIEDLRVQRRVG